jgi:single-strand DNA-binding protein
MNQVNLLGAVGSAEVRATANGKFVLNFTLATNYSYKKGDEWVQEVEWHKVTHFSPSDFLKENIVKGATVLVNGRLKTDQYEKNGVTMYSTKIIVEQLQVVKPAGGQRLEKVANQQSTQDATNQQSTQDYEREDFAPDWVDDDLPV